MRFIGISGQDSIDEMRVFVDEYGMGNFEHIADASGGIWRAFAVSAQPSYVFINDNGEISRHIGPLETDEMQAQIELLRVNN